MTYRLIPRPGYLLSVLIAYTVIACAAGVVTCAVFAFIAFPYAGLSFIAGILTSVLTRVAGPPLKRCINVLQTSFLRRVPSEHRPA